MPAPRVLIVDDEPDITDFISFMINSEIDAETHEVASGKEAVEVLQSNVSWDLIISDFNMPNGNGWSLFQYLLSHGLHIPFLLATSECWESHPEFHNYSLVGYIEKPFDAQELICKVHRLFEEKGKLKADLKKTPEYLALSIKVLHEIYDISVPLFIRLNETKFVKLLNEDFKFDALKVAKFKSKGIKQLYVKQQDFQVLTEAYRKKAFNDFYFQSFMIDEHEGFTLSQNTEELIQKSIQYFGFNEEVIQLGRQAIQVVKNIVSRTPNLGTFLRWISDKNFKYEEARSTLICYLAAAIHKEQALQSENALENLALAAYFQDCSMSAFHIENEFRFREALKLKMPFNREDIEAVRNHPQSSAEIVRQVAKIPHEVLEIIESHCERPDGNGFPRGLGAKDFNELTACFVFCEDLANQFLSARNQFDVYLKSSKSYYAEEPFQTYFQLFENIMERKEERSRFI